jgi:hypothetical protein
MLKPAGKVYGRYLRSNQSDRTLRPGQSDRGAHKMANAKQPKYTAFLLFKEIVPDAAAEMMLYLSDAQIEGRAPMADVDVAFIEECMQAEEEHARVVEDEY